MDEKRRWKLLLLLKHFSAPQFGNSNYQLLGIAFFEVTQRADASASPKKQSALARTSEGNTCEICSTDFQLFDGQQRLTTILLGLAKDNCITDSSSGWTSAKPPDNSDLRFILRIVA